MPVVVAATAVQALVTMSAVVPSAIAPALAGSLAVPTELIGYQIAIVYGGAMVTSVVGGATVRRWGACRVSQAALALCGVGGLLAALPSLLSLAAASVLIGLGYGLTNPASSHLLEARATARNRNLIFSIKQTGVPLGGIAAGLMAPALTVTVGWPWAFAATAAALLCLAALLQPLRPGWDRERDGSVRLGRSPFADLALVWRSAVLRPLALASFSFAAVQLCLTSFAVALLVEDLAFGLVAAGIVLGAMQASGFFGRVFWGWVADRVGNGFRVLAGIGAVSAVAALALPLLGPGSPAALVSALLLAFAFTAVGWNGVYLAAVARAAPRDRIGSATGGALVFTFAGVLVGPPLFAMAYGWIGTFRATFTLLAVVAALGMLSVHLAGRGDAGRDPRSAGRQP